MTIKTNNEIQQSEISIMVNDYIKLITESIKDTKITDYCFAKTEELNLYYSKLIFVNSLKRDEQIYLTLVANGLSYREISNLINIGHSTIHSKVQKIKNKIKRIMETTLIEDYVKKINKIKKNDKRKSY